MRSSLLTLAFALALSAPAFAADQAPAGDVPPKNVKATEADKDKTDKEGSRVLAAQLLPHPDVRYDRVKDDGVAEAALIAKYHVTTKFQGATA